MDTTSVTYPLDMPQPVARDRGEPDPLRGERTRLDAPADGTLESVRELPAKLLPGERILWQGAPRWRTIALHVFHTRLILIYFALFAIWQTGSVFAEGGAVLPALFAGVSAAALAIPAVGILAGIAWLVQRTTVYTITTRRVLFSIGITLPKTFNIPFSKIESAALRSNNDGTGNVSLKLVEGKKVGVLLLWPHARPWHLRDPEPTFRGIANAAHVARLLSDAVKIADDERAYGAQAGRADMGDAPEAPRAAAASTVAANTEATQKAPPPSPTPLPIKLAGVMVVLCLGLVIGSRLMGLAPVGEVSARPAVIHELQFVPMEEGRTNVLSAATQVPIGVIEPTDDGLLRGALRGFTRSRRLSDIPVDAPYQLIRWDSGSITLTDPLTGDSVPLDAFGPIAGGAMPKLMALVAAETQANLVPQAD